MDAFATRLDRGERDPVALRPGPEGQGRRGQRRTGCHHATKCRATDAAVHPGIKPGHPAGTDRVLRQRGLCPTLSANVRGTGVFGTNSPGTRQRGTS